MFDGQWVTAAAAAKVYGVHPRTIRKWIAAGKLTARMTDEGYLVELPAGMTEIRSEAPAAEPSQETALVAPEPPAIDLAPLAHLVEHLADDNQRLAGEVAYWRHRAESAERQLTAGTPVIAVPPTTTTAPAGSWWDRVRARLRGV